MESWKLTWRRGFLPQLTTAGLQRLLSMVQSDSPKLLQGATTAPPPLMAVQDWPMEAADALTIAAVDDLECTVGEAEEAFAKACFHCDQTLGEPAACRWWLNPYDDWPRDEMRRLLTTELQINLLQRSAVDVAVGGTGLDPALVAALTAAPDDSTLWLATADWFREHDRDDLATAISEFVRKEEATL